MRYDITKLALSNQPHPNTTTRVIRTGCRHFSDWCVNQGLNKIWKIEEKGAVDVVQSYADYLVGRGYSPSTIHTYIYPVCKCFSIPMAEISKPKRTSDKISRSRDPEKNQRGKLEETDPRNQRLVDFQRAVGIRRNELKNLTGDCLKYDKKDKKCFVWVKKGKGGKENYQLILPEDEAIVRRTFDGIAKNERVFSSKEMKNSIDLHGIRAEHARKCYQYYCNLSFPEKKELVNKLCGYWLKSHPGYGKDSKEFKKWIGQIQTGNGRYVLRGANRDRAIKAGRETDYDRIALLLVSGWNLSHWRIDITIAYML